MNRRVLVYLALVITVLVSGMTVAEETELPEGGLNEGCLEYNEDLPEELLVPGDLLIDYFTRVVGTPMEMPYSEMVLYAYDDESLLLEKYENGGSDSEVVTQYLVPHEAYTDILDVIHETGMGSWNDEEGYPITGVYTVCKYQDADDFIRVSSEHMPLDGENAFDVVAGAMGKWAVETYLATDPVNEEENEPEIITETIIGEVLDYSFERNEKTGWTVFHITSGLENTGNAKIMEIRYALTLLNEDGKALEEIKRTWNGQDTPLGSGDAVEDVSSGQVKIDGEVLSARLSILSTKTAEELPPIHVPRAGEYLYQALDNEHVQNIDGELPVRFDLWIDQGGARSEGEITDPDTIRNLVDAFIKIRIRGETDEFVTDNYNGFSMTFADGEQYSVSLNLYNLEYNIYGIYHMYRLGDFTEFWNLMILLTEDTGYSVGILE